jgi:hypothetical protein
VSPKSEFISAANLLKATVLELTGIMNRLTPVDIAKAVRKPVNSCFTLVFVFLSGKSSLPA